MLPIVSADYRPELQILEHKSFDKLDCKSFKYRHVLTGKSSYPLRVLDMFSINNEMDILEIRLYELWDVVDEFIIIEETITQRGIRKPLYFNEVKHKKFSKFLSKIRHIIFDPINYTVCPEDVACWQNFNPLISSAWEEYKKMTNQYLFDQVLIIVGDLDEITSFESILHLKNCDAAFRILGGNLVFYNYFFNYTFKSDFPVNGIPNGIPISLDRPTILIHKNISDNLEVNGFLKKEANSKID